MTIKRYEMRGPLYRKVFLSRTFLVFIISRKHMRCLFLQANQPGLLLQTEALHNLARRYRDLS